MSTEYQAPAAPFARKLAGGRSFGGTSVYDGVFAAGGPGKYGAASAAAPRAENYAEIFGGSRDARRSSIPVLDFPGLHERKAPVDVRSSKLDYAKIFGGRGDFGDAASYEELVDKRAERRSFADDARRVRIPVFFCLLACFACGGVSAEWALNDEHVVTPVSCIQY